MCGLWRMVLLVCVPACKKTPQFLRNKPVVGGESVLFRVFLTALSMMLHATVLKTVYRNTEIQHVNELICTPTDCAACVLCTRTGRGWKPDGLVQTWTLQGYAREHPYRYRQPNNTAQST